MKGVPSPFAPFAESRCPDWRCPSCYNQTLRIRAGTFHCRTSAASRKRLHRFLYDPDPSDVSYVFSCLLECTRNECLETVAVSGEGWCEEKVKKSRGGIEVDVVEIFRAKSFVPPLPLFTEPEGCPQDVREQLKVISSLLTFNYAAAANAIRRLLEILMEVMDVPQASSLYERIRKGLEIFGDDVTAIHALRGFGNAGSHGNEITRTDLEDACLVLEAVIKKFCHAAPDISHVVERLEAAFRVQK